MLFSYLKIAWRTLRKNRVYSVINLLGLAVGMAVCLLILLYVQDELAYDDHHVDGDRVYRVTRQFIQDNGEVSLHLSHIAPPFAPLLRQDYPELEQVARLWYGGLWLYSVDGETHRQVGEFAFAEPEVFEIFTIPVISGDIRGGLAKPNTTAISETLARELFGDEDPIGRTVTVDNEVPVEVIGVFADTPHQTHLPLEAVVSFESLRQMWPSVFEMDNWGSNNYGTYVKMAPGTDVAAFEAKLPEFLDRHLPSGTRDDGTEYHGSDWTALRLQPLQDIYLKSHLDDERTARGDIQYVWLFSLVAAGILLIACVNFMNLATARSASRAREVGLRKVIGANRRMLIGQFLGESMLITALALVLAVILVELSLPYFADFVGRPFGFSLVSNLWMIPMLLAAWAGVSLLAGFYPALYLSAFKPGKILRGELTRGTRAALTRKALVVMQFTVSVALIVAVGVVVKQMQFIQSKKLGFDAENVITISTSNDRMRQEQDLIKQRILDHPGVISAAYSNIHPTQRLLNSGGAGLEMPDGEFLRYPVRLPDVVVDADFFRTFDIPLVAGRGFDERLASDSLQGTIVNEAAAREVGYLDPAEIVGKRLQYRGQDGYVIGVAADHHFESLHQQITPIVFHNNPDWFQQLSVRVAPGQTPAVMDMLEGLWDEYWPNWPFRYQFLDDRLEQLYRGEQQVQTLFLWFAGLAVLIACLGLLGLAAYTAERRTKEIGIRKTLGASASSIVMLLSREFAMLVIIANAVAWPVAWWGMRRWLEGFAYKAALSADLFVLAGLAALVIAVLTVASQALGAASIHPVRALRQDG